VSNLTNAIDIAEICEDFNPRIWKLARLVFKRANFSDRLMARFQSQSQGFALADALERLKFAVDKGGGAKEVAAGTGIAHRTLYGYLRGDSEMRASSAAAIADFCDVDLQWLITGREPPLPTGSLSEVLAGAPSSYPVVGLASCGLRAWYLEDEMSVGAELRLDDPDAFAVLATGDSLRPEGVRNGYLCFCAPSYSRRPGDLVFVERGDGTAALKRLVNESADAIVVEGWLSPEGGRQDPYREEIKRSYVRRLAVVVYVKRRL